MEKRVVVMSVGLERQAMSSGLVDMRHAGFAYAREFRHIRTLFKTAGIVVYHHGIKNEHGTKNHRQAKRDWGHDGDRMMHGAAYRWTLIFRIP